MWEVDTITVCGGTCHGLYAISSEDIWIAFIGSYNEKLQHFNGLSWNPVILEEYSVTARIVGKAPNDIWLLPHEGNFKHFNGVQWNSVDRIDKSGESITHFYSMAWNRNDETYIVGQACGDNYSNCKPILAKLYGDKYWRFIEIQELEGAFPYITYDKSTDKFYILFWPDEGPEQVYSFDEKGLVLYDENRGGLNIREIGRETYISKNGYLYRVNSNGPEKLLENKFGNSSIAVFGRNEKDIFIQYNGELLHYNGTDIEKILNYSTNTYFTDDSVTDNFITFVMDGGSNYYIYKGKLQGE